MRIRVAKVTKLTLDTNDIDTPVSREYTVARVTFPTIYTSVSSNSSTESLIRSALDEIQLTVNDHFKLLKLAVGSVTSTLQLES